MMEMKMRFRIKQSTTKALLIAIIALVSCALPRCAYGQTPTGDCIDYNGHVVRCSPRPSGGSSGGSTYSGPSAAEIKAEQARAAERARLAAEEERLAEEHRAEEARRQQEHEEWLRSVANAAGSLKGVSTDDMGLKGVGNDTAFGLKGVTPAEAASNPNYGIKMNTTAGTPQSVAGAWQQLHCAAAFAGDAVADLRKIETGEADARELDEIKFVAGQASTVMHGGTVTVDTSTCGGSGPMPVNLSSTEIEHETPVIDGLLTRTVHDAETYVASQQKADALRQKPETLRTQKPAPDTEQPTNPARPASTSAPPSQAGHTFNQVADQQRINEIYQQQKENEKKNSDYLALLRETQRALNEANSQKISSQADADRVQKETQAIMSGQFTSTSSGAESQATK